MDYKKSTNYHQMWQAKDLVRDWYLGGQKKIFHLIPTLLERMHKVDPGAMVDWSTQGDTRVFNGGFVSPSTMRDALNYCQLVLCLDACHTKNKIFPKQVFMAMVLDGNMGVLTLCYALAPVENIENWTWFLDFVAKSIYGVEEAIVPFIYKCCKGLLAIVHDIFLDVIHMHCANHF